MLPVFETYEQARQRAFDRQTLGAVRFDGVMVVADAERLAHAIARGIGPAKAFGFGLLTVAPLR